MKKATHVKLKEEAYKKVIGLLQDEIGKVNRELARNSYELKKLAEKNTILKREKTKIIELIRDIAKDAMFIRSGNKKEV